MGYHLRHVKRNGKSETSQAIPHEAFKTAAVSSDHQIHGDYREMPESSIGQYRSLVLRASSQYLGCKTHHISNYFQMISP